ncbi:MAG: 4-alpha-glucanotransferase [Haliea sp.]|uniref:4-alpha-glucanotransferase n=1 Tax=Haliea sp. TaxID=1932666 RepID=UPI0032EFA628
MTELDKLLYLCGISADYLDYGGQRQEVPMAHRQRVLRLMGVDSGDPGALAAAVDRLDVDPWRHWLPHHSVVAAAVPEVSLRVHPNQLAATFSWELTLESGELVAGECRPDALAEVGDYHADGVRYSARRLPLPSLVPGYHALRVTDGLQSASSRVMACPDRFYAPQPSGHDRVWGFSCQLYTLRSARNWGLGDFSDLRELLPLAAAAGADLVGLNPLHAPCTDGDAIASPYSPSDRRFLNPQYIDPEREPEWDAVVGTLATAAWQERRARLQAAPLVDYEGVNRLKYEALEAMFSVFRREQRRAGTERGRAFRRFVAEGGSALEGFARYEARHNAWARSHRADPQFYAWLQWLASCQLQHCQQLALDSGMRIGLMRDLAVGAVGRGCEVEQARGLYLTEASIGAPPDPFAPHGQDWGLPVPHPLRLRESGFRFFIDLLHKNMSACGALRVDHVMALMRLWWCLHDAEDNAGLYVFYPRDELLALLRLESWRNRCVVIGEDMGVVPEEFRQAMQGSALLGNRLFYFEQHHDGRFRAPAEFPPDVLLMVTNHDVPTLADWWQGSDLRRRRELGLIADEDALAREQGQREADRAQLCAWLEGNGLLPAEVGGELDMNLCSAIHRACARSASRLLLLQLEDLQLLAEPVNIPGTWREYPNWRRKQLQSTADIFAAPRVQALLAAVDRERRA